MLQVPYFVSCFLKLGIQMSIQVFYFDLGNLYGSKLNTCTRTYAPTDRAVNEK